ncbi:hypothetical protein [Roseateles oligotrophus]|uniref:SPOR domain-containing protein n=1 Tax=Roseateles oligotrophus TaxID=1769250 RepID=A0ABT2YIQ0_9BURK|nr:hypothetical protein [Roseateles oligotrophus]MCV2369936.1 hypothetical protein [Roseateles oligotrophus]
MDRLAEQVVAWHNRHPLAKRITIYDVHTIGVVALPFMRNAQADAAARQAGARGKVEPVLTDEISAESLAAAWDEEGLTIAVNPNAAHLDALADQEPLPDQGEPAWRALLGRLAFWRGKGKKKDAAAEAKSWPVFSERFVSHLSPRSIAAFAQAHGYTSQPGDATWPQRIVPIDEALMEKSGAASGSSSGAWPFELYLMSAAIDAGRSRSRILLGRGRQPAITGRRCYSPRRLGLVALLLLAVLGAGAALLLPQAKKAESAAAATPAASAAAASAASAVSTPAASGPASTPAPSTEAASHVPTPTASAAMPEAVASASLPLTPIPSAISLQASAAAAREASKEAEQAEDKPVPRPDIRPMFIKPIPGRTAPPLGAPPKQEQTEPEEVKKADKKPEDKKTVVDLSAKPEPIQEEPPKPKAKSALAHASKPKLSSEGANAPAPSAATTAAAISTAPKEPPPSSKAIAKASSLVNKPVVALVGPVSANKADAEATLARMRAMLSPAQGGAGGAALQAQVFQTPEGYRPAVWPFASREEAQLINATLIARGMRTRAVDF